MKYELTLSIGYSQADITEEVTLEDLGYDLDEWISLSEIEQTQILDDYIKEWSFNYIELNYKKLK